MSRFLATWTVRRAIDDVGQFWLGTNSVAGSHAGVGAVYLIPLCVNDRKEYLSALHIPKYISVVCVVHAAEHKARSHWDSIE